MNNSRFLEEIKKALKNLKSIKTFYKEIPNLLTLSRFILTLFIIINILSGNLILGGILTGIASLTDCFDGFLARKLSATSELGRKMDAVIDKIFIISIALSLSSTLPLLLIPIALEGIIASINSYSHIKGYQPKTSELGRKKTIFLDALIASSFFTKVPILLPLQIGLYISTIGLQIKVGIDYYQTLKQAQKNDIKQKEIIENNDIKENKQEKQLVLKKK
ncbi:MAG: CDP-alcohol phosphatidyltransferase family protein [Mollicutes bacterium]|nr:CDP-alcohol phosphatidyltransferase family protein [Mollicutes bacterium]